MKAMILAAGKGTRLAPLTEKVPKPMIPISSEPLIVHQIRWLKRGGITEIVINLHHLADQIKNYLGSGRRFGVDIEYSIEDELLETGGGIVKALSKLGSEPFLLLNGDIWTSYRFQNQSLSNSSHIHVILAPKPDYRESGDFNLRDELVSRSADASKNPFVYCGIAYVNPTVFENESVRQFSFREILFREIDNESVTGEVFENTWIDIGSHDQLKRVRRLML